MAKKDTSEFEPTLTNFTRFLHAKIGVRASTVNNIISCMTRFWPVAGLDPTEDQINEYITEMHNRNVSQAHIANTSVAIERYTLFLKRPIKLGRPRAPKYLVKGTLSEAEVTRLLAIVTRARDKAMLVLLAFTGIRNQELCNLTVEEIELENRTINLRGTKIVKDRILPLPPVIIPTIQKYLEEREGGPEDIVFLTTRNKLPLEQQDVRKSIRTWAKRAGIRKRVYPHLLRHSLATNLVQSGTGLLAIKEQLGHVNMATTMRYLHADPERLRQEMLLHTPNYGVPKIE